ncbi:unnamed protein product, partial [Candidula unifasciata]
MAAYRNVQSGSVQGFETTKGSEKTKSSTLKRQPCPDWSKADLLRLLSYFEGELQAKDIIIATLKAEKAKQLLYQAKYGRFGLGDPFIALQRDAEGKNDASFDEAAIKSMYDNQLAQLENLIATQRKAQLKMREQLGNSEKRFHKVCTELEEEKQKHAQDTAQGDDVTYMLEKERERLKTEIDFEKNQNKKLEKDLKKTLASLEEERANAARHKQVAIMLIKVLYKPSCLFLRDEMETALKDGKSKMQNMAEGLAEESKKSLKMEAAIEKQTSKFDAEREALRIRLQEEEKQTVMLRGEVAQLLKQVEALHQHQQQIRNSGSSPSNIQVRSSVSPSRAASPSISVRSGATSQPSGSSTLYSITPSFGTSPPQPYLPMSITTAGGVRPTGLSQVLGSANRTYAQPGPRVIDSGRVGSSSPESEVIYRSENASAAGSIAWRGSSPGLVKIGPPTALVTDHAEMDLGPAARVSVSPGLNAPVHAGNKTLHAGSSPQATPSSQMRKSPGFGSPAVSPLGRGVPPPIPPNKPNFVAPGPTGGRPSLPKVSVVGPNVVVQTAGRDIFSGQYSHAPAKSPSQHPPRAVQIPINVVSSSAPSGSPPKHGGAIANVRTQVRETSPSAVRKTSQV